MSTHLPGFQSFFFFFALFCIKIGKISHPVLGLRVTLEIVVWILDTFDNYLEIKKYFTKYLKESWM